MKCINPTEPDADRNLEAVYTPGTTIEFGDTVTYKCKLGTFFEEDYYMTGFDITCLTDGSWSPLPDKRCLDPSCKIWHILQSYKTFYQYAYFAPTVRYCPNPPDPDSNGGLYDWQINDLFDVTPYGTTVTYSCDTARLLLRGYIPDENGNLVADLHETQTKSCQWDQTWSPDLTVCMKK